MVLNLRRVATMEAAPTSIEEHRKHQKSASQRTATPPEALSGRQRRFRPPAPRKTENPTQPLWLNPSQLFCETGS